MTSTTGIDPSAARATAATGTRAREPDEKVCIVTAGGSAVGTPLISRAVAAFPEAKRRVPGLRMIVIAGPRLDPDSLPQVEGLEVHGYVHRLYRRLAASDVVISHGGLSTTMELTAARRPFLYFPLRSQFEQNLHVVAGDGAARAAAIIAELP